MSKKSFKEKINELMEKREQSLIGIENLNKAMEENTADLRKEIGKLEARMTDLTEEDGAEIALLHDTISEIANKIEGIMKENNIKEFPNKYNLIKYSGRRKGDVKTAKAILSKEVYKLLIKEEIPVGKAEGVLDPDQMKQIFTESAPSLAFNKPNKKIKEITYSKGIKQVSE